MLSIFAPFFAGFVRHALGNVAGVLIAQGFLKGDQANAFIGACMLFGAIGWSVWQKLNTPVMLARLTARASQKTQDAKKDWTSALLRQQGACIAIGGVILTGLLASVPSPAGAQEWFSPPAKVVHHHKKHLAPPMKAGLSSLIQAVSPVQISVQGPDQLVANLSKVALDDLQMALASANAVQPPSNASKARVACYGALVALISQQSSAAVATQGSAVGSGVFTHFERLAQLNDALQSGSPVQVACAPVAQAMRLQFAQFLTTVTAGGLGLAKFGLVP